MSCGLKVEDGSSRKALLNPVVELDVPIGRLNRGSLRAAQKCVATDGLVQWALITHRLQEERNIHAAGSGRRPNAERYPS
jgi:hypothetical protein